MGCMISKGQKVYRQEELTKGIEYLANIIYLILRCVMYSVSGSGVNPGGDGGDTSPPSF